MGGSVRVESNKDEGTRFIVCLKAVTRLKRDQSSNRSGFSSNRMSSNRLGSNRLTGSLKQSIYFSSKASGNNLVSPIK